MASLSKENGMFGKSKSVERWKAQPLQRPALARATTALQPLQTISSLSSEMTVVGKIICKGVIKIHGLVEGEVNASNALIADGARIQGDIVAEELTVAGRVEGDIYALRVKLQDTAVVEGDIFHRSLSMDEHARFEGCSRPEDNPPEPGSYIKAESSDPQPQPQTLVAFADKAQFRGKANEAERNQAGGGYSRFPCCVRRDYCDWRDESFRPQRSAAADRTRLYNRRRMHRSRLDWAIDTAVTSFSQRQKAMPDNVVRDAEIVLSFEREIDAFLTKILASFSSEMAIVLPITMTKSDLVPRCRLHPRPNLSFQRMASELARGQRQSRRS
jgi:cytoskeletal protein CcmA (bactofilin family)